LREAKGARWLRFSHYDQVIEAALKGSGVAVGKLPHLSHHLRTGALVAPLGNAGQVKVGAFYIEVARTAAPDATKPFIEWLYQEAARDAGTAPRKARGGGAPRRSGALERQ